MLDKAIASGKEHRKAYQGAKAIDRTCRNHGTCSWCEETRTFFDSKHRRASLLDSLEIEDIENLDIMNYSFLKG